MLRAFRRSNPNASLFPGLKFKVIRALSCRVFLIGVIGLAPSTPSGWLTHVPLYALMRFR